MSIEIARLRALVLVVIIMLSSVACSERRSEAERPPALALGLVRTFEVDLRRFGATPSVQRRAEASSSHEGFELVSGTLEWKGRVEIVRIAEADNRVLEELAIVEQEGGVLTIGETRTSLPDWSQAPTLRYITDQRGHLEELVFEEEHDSLYQNLVQTILLDAVPAAPRSGTTVASEAVTDLLGRSRVTWRALEARDGSQSYRRTRDSNLMFSDDSIEKWAAAGQIQASGYIDYRIRAGLIEACNGTEEVKVVADDRTTYHYRLSLEVEEVSRRVDPERAQPDALAQIFDDSVPPGAIRATPSEVESMLRNQAGGYTTKDILDDAAVFGFVGKTDGWGARFYRAAGLAELSADTARALGERARHPSTSLGEVAYLTDVLVAASTPVAQQELLEIFRTDRLSSAPTLVRGNLHTRLGFVADPSVAILDYMAREYRAAGRTESDYSGAVTMALGATLKRFRAKDTELWNRSLDLLREGYRAVHSMELRREHIIGLGNVESELVLDLLVKAAASKTGELRAAAASAISTIPTLEREQTMIALVEDKAMPVQHSALEGFIRSPPSRSAEEALRELVIAGRIRPINFRSALSALSGLPASEMLDVVDYMASHELTTADLQRVLRETRRRIEDQEDT